MAITSCAASASGGLIDDLLAVRLSGSVTERRGFLYNDTQNERAQDYSNWSVRGQLLFTLHCRPRSPHHRRLRAPEAESRPQRLRRLFRHL